MQLTGRAALLAAPLPGRGRNLGALVVANLHRGRPFDAHQVELCEGIARQLAGALERVELYRVQREEAEIAAALARVGREMISTLDTPIILERLCRLGTEVLECDASCTLLWDADEHVYVPISGYGVSEDVWELVRVLRLPASLFSAVLQGLVTDEVVQVRPDESLNPDVPRLSAPFDLRTLLYTGLRRGDALIGLQRAVHRGHGRRFSARHLRLARGGPRVAVLRLDSRHPHAAVQLASRPRRAAVPRRAANMVRTSNHPTLEGRMRGLMMDYPLTLTHFLERARRLFPHKPIVTRAATGLQRYTYADLYRRTCRLGNALRTLGVRRGERVASFAWNSHRHLELYLGVPASGAVLHTLNIRLFPEQIGFIVNHAEDAVICVDESLVATLEPLARAFRGVRAYVVMGDGPLPATSLQPAYRYEDLLAAAADEYEFPTLDEGVAASICYTSGTTGNPKGVVYSHRALVLQSLAQASADAFGLREADVVMPVVPMFHANAWGLPYTATMVGATQVYPGVQPTPQHIAELIQELRVTVTGGVPTVLIGLLAVLDQQRYDLSSLRCVPCGGSAVPESLLARFDEIGVQVVQAWGMTETAPLATLSQPRSTMRARSATEQRAVRAKQGTPVPFVELRVVDDDGREAPWDGKTMGELQVRGPWVVGEYYNDPRSGQAFQDGWFKTGDIATIDADGYVQITDRAKDVIKSGGEWISSVELENAIMAHPQVLEAAVVGLPHERWQERPLACVVVKPGAQLTKQDIIAHLTARVAKWWLPADVVFIAALPKTSVGKIAKRELREQFKDYRWPADA